MCAMLLLFYASGTVEGVAFDVACDSTNTCTEDRTECSSSTNKCACTSAAYRNQNNDECVTKVVLDATCLDGEPATQCADGLAECRDESGFKCLCKAANYKSGSVCKVKVALDATCVNTEPDDQCVDLAECKDDGGFKCFCKAANYKSGTECKVKKAPGATCDTGECVTNAKCNTTCICNTGYTATPTTTPISCQSSDAAIIIAHMYVFIFGIVASLYFLV